MIKVRASEIGSIVTGIGFEPIHLTEKQALRLEELRSKGSSSKEREELERKLVALPENKLSSGALTFIEQKWYENKYQYSKSFWNKYVEKGVNKEVFSISQINEYLGIFATKNNTFYVNDFSHGTPDIVLPSCIIDAKNVWFPESLMLFENGEDKGYIWQIHDYNWLTEKQKGYVVRILVNPPENVIEKEAWTLWKNSGNEGAMTEEFVNEVRDMYDWEYKMPLHDRIRAYEVNTTDNEHKIMQKAVELMREEWARLDKLFSERKKISIA
jgi:hypothetical protein